MSEKMRCDRCHNLISTEQAQRFESPAFEFSFFNGVYCPTCYASVRAKLLELLDLGIKAADAQIKAAKVGLIGTIFGLKKR